jgi:hypothetical protein
MPTPLGSAITYQGQLKENGRPADGTYDFRFTLYDAKVGGSQVSSVVFSENVLVKEGLFSVLLDFGSGAFNNYKRWLEIGVRTGNLNDPNEYITLSPRQELTAIPYALFTKTQIVEYNYYGVKESYKRRQCQADLTYDFSDINDWNAAGFQEDMSQPGDVTAVEIDSPVLTGLKSIKVSLETDATAYVVLYRNVAADNKKIDFSGHNFQVRYYIDPETYNTLKGNDVVQIRFGNISYFSWYDNMTLNLPYAAGWNTVEFTWGRMDDHGKANHTVNPMIGQIRFVFHPGANHPNAYIIWDSFEMWPSGAKKGSILWGFDDSYVSQYTVGIRYLAKYGFPSVLYTSSNMIGYPGYMTWEQVAACQDLGALIATHYTRSPVDMYGYNYTDDQLRAWCRTLKEPLYKRGYNRGADYIALPGGQKLGDYRGPQDYPILREFFSHIRGTAEWWQDTPIGDPPWPNGHFGGCQGPMPRYRRAPWWECARYVNNNIAVNNSHVDNVVADHDVKFFTFHEIVDGGTEITPANFRELVDYVAQKVAERVLEVISVEDLVRGTSGTSDVIDGAIVVNKTSNYQVRFVDHLWTFTNAEATDHVTFTLPPAHRTMIGREFIFFVKAPQELLIAPYDATETITVNGTQQAAGRCIRSTNVGASCHVKCIIEGQWEQTDIVGSWQGQ